MFQKEMYLYVKLLCLHAENYFSFFFFLITFSFGGSVGGFNEKKRNKT